MFSRCLMVTLGLLCCAQLWASQRPAWVTVEVLNVRQGPGTNTERVAQLRLGDRVTVTAFRSDRWCRATLPDGGTGWVREDHLEFSRVRAEARISEAVSSSATRQVQGSVVNMRAGRDVGSRVLGQLRSGDSVKVVAQEGNWSRVQASSGVFGYIRSDLLGGDAGGGGRAPAAASTPAPSPAPARAASPSNPVTAWVSGNVVNVRKGPSTGYSQAGQFTKGTKVFILERKDGWARCKGPVAEGWVHGDYLETNVARGRQLVAEGAGSQDKAYCVGSVVRLRKGPSTDTEQMGDVLEGTTLWIQEERNGWCRVRTEFGHDGWIAGWLVRRHGANTTVAPAPGDSAPRPAPPSAPEPPAQNFPSPTRPAVDTSTALQPFRAWISNEGINVRYGPGVDRDVKFQLGKHTPVEVLETQGQWCRIRTDSGTVGWAAGWVLDFQPPGVAEATKVVDGQEFDAKAGWVDRPRVNVRAAPGTDNDVVTSTTAGTEVVIVDQQDGWFRVALSDGTTGWVAENLVKTRGERAALEGASPTPLEDGSSRGREIVREAMRHMGKSYVRGATGPNSFDCSGLTTHVFRQFGISLPRTSSGQYMRGRPVSRDELQQGDVVVFRNTYRAGISHVGIYIGQGRFIHASNSRTGVKITDLDSSYYAPRYVGARRMF